MMEGRYAHAKRFNRHRRQLHILRTRLGRLIRDIRRKIAGNADLEAVFATLACRSRSARSSSASAAGSCNSFHAPEVECIRQGQGQRALDSV
jgi:IS5 family transposase